MRYQNRVLSKYLSLCTCNYPFYSAYKSLIHRVNFGQFKLSTDIEKNPGPSVYVDATKTIHAPYCQGNVVVFEENAGQQCVAMSLRGGGGGSPIHYLYGVCVAQRGRNFEAPDLGAVNVYMEGGRS